MALKDELKTQGDFLFRYRSYLPVIVLVLSIILFVRMELQDVEFQYKKYYELFCFLICLLGFFIRIYAIGHSADHTSGRNTSAGQVAETINSTGFYSVCRHPLYLGNFFIWLGLAMFTQHFYFNVAFIFAYWLYYERIMYAEESFLIKTYGDAYTNWAKDRPAFVPKFSLWKKPSLSFSWKKIIRQEKTGFLNLMLIIFIYKVLAYYFAAKPIEMYWIIGFAASILWYVVIKTIQKTTSILEIDRK